MRICAIADTHNKHHYVDIPKCDVFICAGDFTNYKSNIYRYINFNNWIKWIKADHKIVVGGNHDNLLYEKNILHYLNNCVYLEDSEVIIDGLKFYGSPWDKMFHQWLFKMPPDKFIQQKWNDIPDDTDILITHTPPYKIFDDGNNGEHFGCEYLLDRVFKVQPKVHIFGHTHSSGGKNKKIGNTLFYNVAKSFKETGYIIDI